MIVPASEQAEAGEGVAPFSRSEGHGGRGREAEEGEVGTECGGEGGRSDIAAIGMVTCLLALLCILLDSAAVSVLVS